MSLNVTITGNIYTSLDSPYIADEVYYQIYFHKVNNTSSDSIWGTTRTSIAGQYNFNLADSDLLTTEGVVGSGDVVVIVFWNGDSSDRYSQCSNLYEWSTVEVLLTTNTLYVIDVQTKPNIPPNLIWGIDSVGYINTNYTSFNRSDDEHAWEFKNNQMYHWSSKYGQDIQLVNDVLSTSYDWGDGETTLDLVGSATGSHVWEHTGVYNISISIKDMCGVVVSGTKSITIKNHAPEPDIICHQAVSNVILNPNTFVTFGYSGTDVDDNIISIGWHIVDGGVYGDTDTYILNSSRDAVVSHTSGLGTHWYGVDNVIGSFTNPEGHTVTITVVWNDGFVDHTLTYSKEFIQEVFVGPIVDFIQSPSKPTVSGLITFENSSSNISMVGTYTPYGHEYDWAYNDSGKLYQVDNITYTDNLLYTATTSSGVATLSAYWNDGWENHITNHQKNVTFATSITIIDEECYYSLHIVGTSSNGTVTGYKWEVYKYIDGGLVLTWESPIGVDQNDKKVCFTSIGLYQIKGYVYGTGNTTEAYINKEIDLVCPTEAYVYIWNGTGIDDIGGDWIHTGVGYESPQAKKSGTNGLDLSNLNRHSKFSFSRIGPPIGTAEYDFISLYVKVLYWDENSDIYLRLHNVGQPNGELICLKEYVHIYNTDEWQHVFIPLASFKMCNHMAGFINELSFSSSGNISIYMDDVMLGVGSIITRFMDVCSPDMHSYEVGEKSVQAHEIKPSMKVSPMNRSFPAPLQ